MAMKGFVRRTALLVASFLLFAATNRGVQGSDEATISTVFVEANSANFTCNVLGHGSDHGNQNETGYKVNVLLLHGFPMNRMWYDPLLELWADKQSNNETFSFHAVACDLRGYSAGASPDSISEYDYDILIEDVRTLASTTFGDGEKFHLVGHDHGALLGWVVASQSPPDEIVSYTAMSIPHPDRSSAALCGGPIDQQQEFASNYFNHWSHHESATLSNNSITNLFSSFFGFPLDAALFQKQLWWYNASFPRVMALPRVLNDSEIPEPSESESLNLQMIRATRAAIPIEPRPCIPQEEPIGIVAMPVHMVCGSEDSFLLCAEPYTRSLLAGGGDDGLTPHYMTTTVACGHDFFAEGNCVDLAESQFTMERITNFILTQARDDGMLESTATNSNGNPLATSNGKVLLRGGGIQMTAMALMGFVIVYS